MSYTYLINKINGAKIINYPFPHIQIDNFLSKNDLNNIINDTQIHFSKKDTNDNLYEELIENGWKIQNFPGCISDWEEYKKYIDNKKYISKRKNPVENIGITFRLSYYNNKKNEELLNFLNSDLFHNTLKDKFNLTKSKTNIISAIQKNLTGYEISPHPDTRNKALTYLLNINNNQEIEDLDCHTHLLEFKDQYKYISNFWIKNQNINRCWVPWNYCNTIKTINKNNTLIIFKPNDSPPTLHAIRLNYDHLKFQRTQIYGNLMYNENINYKNINYKDYK